MTDIYKSRHWYIHIIKIYYERKKGENQHRFMFASNFSRSFNTASTDLQNLYSKFSIINQVVSICLDLKLGENIFLYLNFFIWGVFSTFEGQNNCFITLHWRKFSERFCCERISFDVERDTGDDETEETNETSWILIETIMFNQRGREDHPERCCLILASHCQTPLQMRGVWPTLQVHPGRSRDRWDPYYSTKWNIF